MMGALTSSDPGNMQETIQVKSVSHTGLQSECTVHPNRTGMKVIRHAGVDSRMIIFTKSSPPTNDLSLLVVTVKVQLYACEKFMRFPKIWLLNKYMRFLFMRYCQPNT